MKQKLATIYKTMRVHIYVIATMVAVFVMLAQIAHAEESSLSIDGLLSKIFFHIINPVIMVAFAGSVLYFIYGVVDFLKNRDTNIPEADDGKRHLVYGLIGLFIMTSAFAIARIMSSILGGGVPTP
jgi:hypothetical protein